jgi:hypothetical protein
MGRLVLLHVYSHYSLFEGVDSPAALAVRAAEWGYSDRDIIANGTARRKRAGRRRDTNDFFCSRWQTRGVVGHFPL